MTQNPRPDAPHTSDDRPLRVDDELLAEEEQTEADLSKRIDEDPETVKNATDAEGEPDTDVTQGSQGESSEPPD
jgi:hypothetical protein